MVLYQKQKIQQLDQALWQAILGEKENAQFWRVRQQPSNYPQSFDNNAANSVKALLSFVRDVHQHKYALSQQQETQIEQHLQQLTWSDAGAMLLRFKQIHYDLELANQVIAKRLEKPLCLSGMPTQKARYFKNVVNQFFIKKVQVEAVHLTQRYQQLMPDYLFLEEQLQKASPKSYKTWKSQRDQVFQQALVASKTHVNYIKQLFDQCGLSVGL